MDIALGWDFLFINSKGLCRVTPFKPVVIGTLLLSSETWIVVVGNLCFIYFVLFLFYCQALKEDCVDYSNQLSALFL